jgi:surface protein
MFNRAHVFSSDLSHWDVGIVQDFSYTFSEATAFNSNLSLWNVTHAETMKGMFFATTSFNSNLSTWNVSSVTDMTEMFLEASVFSQNLCSWGEKVQNKLEAASMFTNSSCPVQVSPDVTNSSQGPWCWDCSWFDLFEQ